MKEIGPQRTCHRVGAGGGMLDAVSYRHGYAVPQLQIATVRQVLWGSWEVAGLCCSYCSPTPPSVADQVTIR
jgi:hypothetical protein